MFEVPEWAECSVASATGLAQCRRRVTKVVSILVQVEEDQAEFETVGVCDRHVEVVEMVLAQRSAVPPITVARKQFSGFMEDMLANVYLG